MRVTSLLALAASLSLAAAAPLAQVVEAPEAMVMKPTSETQTVADTAKTLERLFSLSGADGPLASSSDGSGGSAVDPAITSLVEKWEGQRHGNGIVGLKDTPNQPSQPDIEETPPDPPADPVEAPPPTQPDQPR